MPRRGTHMHTPKGCALMGWVPYPAHMGPRFAGPIIGAHRLLKKKKECVVRAYGCIWVPGQFRAKVWQIRCEHADRLVGYWCLQTCDQICVYMCPNPTPSPIRCWVLTLLTKCGVVVGVFGLGPKGRGLDSLHLWVPIAGGWFTLQGAH